MGELINGWTPEQIWHWLDWLQFSCGDLLCDECGYQEICGHLDEDEMARATLNLIEHLEAERDAALAKAPKWISVNDMMPEPYQHVIVHVQHTKEWREYTKPEEQWHVVEEDCWLGEGWEGNADTGIHEVTHWMSKPEPPEEGE